MLIDAHTHLGSNSFCDNLNDVFKYELQNNPEDFIQFMNKNGIDKAVILPIPGNNYDSKKSNDYLLQAVVKYPNRFIPFCKFDKNLAVNLMCNGFYGAKYHMVYEKFSKKALIDYYKTLEYYGFPLIIHAKFRNKPKQIHDILSIAPKINLIIAHMGRGHIYTDEMVYDLLDEFKNYPNVFFETSTVGRSNAIEYACNTIGSNRVMFGTDYPFGKAWFKTAFSYNDEIDTILESKISEEDKNNIMWRTISTLISKCDENRPQVYVRPLIPEDKNELISKISDLSNADIKFLALDKKMNLLKDCICKCNHVYVAIYNNEIAGFFRESGRPNNTYMLEEVVIFNELRGRGLSKILLNYFIKFFPNSLAKTHADNEKINSLFTEYGFVPDKGKRIINWTRSDNNAV